MTDMKTNPDSKIKRLLKAFNPGSTRLKAHQDLGKPSGAASDVEFLKSLSDSHVVQALRLLDQSKAQLRQDIFALSQTGFKRHGFFVEFGAANGVDLSNTYLLEKGFAWTGILAEPARCWHKSIQESRTCHFETDCVWGNSKSTLTFLESDPPEFSTIKSFSDADADHISAFRKGGKTYQVNTISLIDLLKKYRAPPTIDYLSIDTEGSEFDILSSFDFGKYRFNVITCEHNFTAARDKIHALLSRHGYIRKLEQLSYFDDWYVRAS